ncbi:MAG: endonuclease [Frankiales bacterium]|nr:endonuclease [Frankiales bacterium]
MGSPAAVAISRQGTFDELTSPLRDVTFVVVDLETTGGSAAADGRITEIGAVKVRRGEVLGEFATLVDPGMPIPPFITVLTGISDAMVFAAPSIDEVLPAFIEFGSGAVLVAHNAPYDVGFLKAACAAGNREWPVFDVLDTCKLARKALTRDEVPNVKLSTLAAHFDSPVTPAHRALADAQATVHVLHCLMERLGAVGVQSWDELRSFCSQVSPAQRRKRHLADPLPTTPGVYLFRDARGRVLYVGKSNNLRARVRSYFVASEPRTRMAEMIAIAESVDHIDCVTSLEAEVRELRLIGQHKPPYNRRSRFPERCLYVKVTVEPFPRLSLVREVRDDGAAYLGPFGSKGSAEHAVEALHETFPIRQCGGRMALKIRRTACVLGEIGKCPSPCDGSIGLSDYESIAEAVRCAVRGDGRPVVDAIEQRMLALATDERFEEAGRWRDRLGAYLRVAARTQRLSMLAGCPEVVAAVRRPDGGWELVAVRHGRLVGTAVAPRGAAPMPFVEAMLATAEPVAAGCGPTPAASAEEMECVLRWLAQPGVRLVRVDGVFACPVDSAERLRGWITRIADARETMRSTDGHSPARPEHRPAALLAGTRG